MLPHGAGERGGRVVERSEQVEVRTRVGCADHGPAVAPHGDACFPIGAVVAELGRREHRAQIVGDGDVAQRVEGALAPFGGHFSDGTSDVGGVLGCEGLEEDEALPVCDAPDESLRAARVLLELGTAYRIGEQGELLRDRQRHRLCPAGERVEHEAAEERHARPGRLGDRQSHDLGAHFAGEVAGREPLLDERTVHCADGQQVPVEWSSGGRGHAGHHIEVLLGEVARRRDELERRALVLTRDAAQREQFLDGRVA